MKNIKQQFERSILENNIIPIFEIEVIDLRTNETEYIIFDITIEKNKFIATHIGLTKKEENSKYIAFKSIVIDSDFTLDENLQELYTECTQAIINSELYEMS